jgi:signal-transduction protein with cAMP-binding, CBS, and nucleotidyltransferase domain
MAAIIIKLSKTKGTQRLGRSESVISLFEKIKSKDKDFIFAGIIIDIVVPRFECLNYLPEYMDSSEIIIWLKENTTLATLPNPVLKAISQVVEEKVFLENYSLAVEDNPVDGLYILREGKLESSSHNPTKTTLCCGILPGAVINLQELLLNQTAQTSFTTLSQSHFFFISGEDFKQLVNQYPEIVREFSRQLVEEVADLESALNYQKERSLALRP